ncbi:hypothetical protein OS493_039885, partial [Desmophyllum pertusum]
NQSKSPWKSHQLSNDFLVYRIRLRRVPLRINAQSEVTRTLIAPTVTGPGIHAKIDSYKHVLVNQDLLGDECILQRYTRSKCSIHLLQ